MDLGWYLGGLPVLYENKCRIDLQAYEDNELEYFCCFFFNTVDIFMFMAFWLFHDDPLLVLFEWIFYHKNNLKCLFFLSIWFSYALSRISLNMTFLC